MTKTANGSKKTKKYTRKSVARGVAFDPELERRITRNAKQARRSFGAEVVFGYEQWLKSLESAK